MNKKIFEAGMSRLIRSYPEKHLDLEIIWDLTKDLSDKQFQRAIIHILTKYDQINKATNIIALIRREALKNDNELTAEEAWGKVVSAVRKFGSYNQPKFADENIGAAVECIGWKTICASENIGVERAHFFRAYDAIRLRRLDRVNNRILGELKLITN